MYNVTTLPPRHHSSPPPLRDHDCSKKNEREDHLFTSTHTYIKIKFTVATVSKSIFAKEVSPGSLRIKARTRCGYETKWVLDKKFIFTGTSPNGTMKMSFCIVSAAARALYSSGQASPISHAILFIKFAIIHHCQTHIKEAGKKSQPLLASSPPQSLNHHWSPHCCSLPSWLQELLLLWAQVAL